MNTTHGHTIDRNISRTFTIWNNMLQRCDNPRQRSYKHYGARGIKVCEQWQKFDGFLADVIKLFGIGIIPDHLTLDRINSDGDYEPGNVRLATMKEQQNNRGNNVNLEWQGRIQTLSQWAEELGIKMATLRKRLFGAGGSPDKLIMSIDRAFTMPVRKTESGCVGVRWNEADKIWTARIMVNNVEHNLGRYANKADAIAARKAAEVSYSLSP